MTTRSIATYERQLRAAQREADISRIATLERTLVSVHRETFPKAQRKVLPPSAPVDAEPLRAALEAEAGIPELTKQLSSEDSPPVAPEPEPVDRYELMREFRKRRRQGIPLWRVRDQIDVAREADQEAEKAADAQLAERRLAQEAEQRRLDGLWSELQQARASVAEDLPGRIAAERERRDAARAAEQQALDEVWRRLQENDPEVTLPALKKAFADNEAPAEATRCEGDRTTVVMHFSPPEADRSGAQTGSHPDRQTDAEETDQNRDQRSLSRSTRQQCPCHREGDVRGRPRHRDRPSARRPAGDGERERGTARCYLFRPVQPRWIRGREPQRSR
jgi:hypothetical protein